MKIKKVFYLIFSISAVSFLGGCKVAYSHPITQEVAKGIISTTKDGISKKDFSSFSGLVLKSKLIEESVHSIFSHTTYLETTYEFSYTASPYSLNIKTISENKAGMESKEKNSECQITKTSTGYEICFNDGEKENINQEIYMKYWDFCDFSSYIKNISNNLITKAYNLIDSVGNEADKKENKLVGFQTSSKGDNNLKIEFAGSNFSLGSVFFEENYNAETASELNVYMDSNLIHFYSTKYAFVINEENSYYEAGTYEGTIEHYFSYID